MIVKMKFLSITGPKADIDRVVNTYLSKYEIHLENALTELSTMQNITPYIQINPYKETLKQAEDFTALLPEDKRTTTKRLSLEDAINCVHGLDHTLGQLNQERTELEAKKERLDGKSTENRAVPGSALQSFLHSGFPLYQIQIRKDHKRVLQQV